MSYKTFLESMAHKRKLCQLMLFIGAGVFFLALLLGLNSDFFSPQFWAIVMVVASFPFGLGIRYVAGRVILFILVACCIGGALLTIQMYDLDEVIPIVFALMVPPWFWSWMAVALKK